MTRDDEHEERGILGRLRRRRNSGPAAASTGNMFTARAKPASPVPPPPEPPPERLFDGVDRWDEPPTARDEDRPLFSEAEGLVSPVEADRPAVPPPPAPTPPPGRPPVPDLGPGPDEPVPDGAASPDRPTPLPPAPQDPPPPPAGPIDGPPVLDPPPPPDASLFGPSDPTPPAATDFFATPPSGPTTSAATAEVDPTAEDLADLTDELHRYAAEDVDAITADPEATGLWAHLAEPDGRRETDEVDLPEELGDNLFVDPPRPTPPPVHLTDDELTEPSQALDEAAASWLEDAAEAVPHTEEPSEPDPAAPSAPEVIEREAVQPEAVEPEAVEPEAVEPEVVAPDPGSSPLLEQIAREFGDPRETLYRLVDGDLEDVPPAAVAPPAAPSHAEPSVPLTDEPIAPPPPAAPDAAFPPAPDDARQEADDLLFGARSAEVEEPTLAPPPAHASEPGPAPDAAPEPRPAPEWAATGQPVPIKAEPATHGPSTIRVHDERLDNRPGPIRMSPSEAVTLAKDGPKSLKEKRPKSR